MPGQKLPIGALMRRTISTLILLSLLAAACGDDAGTTVADSTSSTSSTAPPESMSTTSPIVTSTTSTTTTTTVELQGMCGDLIPVVTDQGTNCVDPDAPVDSEGARRVLIAEDGDLVIYTVGDDVFGFESSLVPEHPVTALHQAADGTIFTREYEDVDEEVLVEIARYAPDGTRSVVDEIVELYDVTVVDGVEALIGAVASADGFGFGGVKALAVDGYGEVADFGLAAEAVFGVTDFMWSEAAGIGVATAWSDLTEWIGFVDIDGNVVTLPSPTDELPYNSPPYVTAATISFDGSTLYWAEGPDWGFDTETNESGPVAGEWVLRGADIETGEERLYWPLSESVLDSAELNIESIEDLDGWILINRSMLEGTTPTFLAPLVLDLTFEEPGLSVFPAIGVANFAAT